MSKKFLVANAMRTAPVVGSIRLAPEAEPLASPAR